MKTLRDHLLKSFRHFLQDANQHYIDSTDVERISTIFKNNNCKTLDLLHFNMKKRKLNSTLSKHYQQDNQKSVVQVQLTQ
jgi:hypothetical protein